MGSDRHRISRTELIMAEVINLRQARKAKTRTAAQQQAASNRAKHGVGKAERARLRGEAERAARLLDGLKRD